MWKLGLRLDHDIFFSRNICFEILVFSLYSAVSPIVVSHILPGRGKFYTYRYIQIYIYISIQVYIDQWENYIFAGVFCRCGCTPCRRGSTESSPATSRGCSQFMKCNLSSQIALCYVVNFLLRHIRLAIPEFDQHLHHYV